MDAPLPPAPDSVDDLIAQWRRTDPSLDVEVIGVVHRLRRVRAHIDQALEGNYAAYGLTATGFGILSALIREAPPHQIGQRRLADILHLTAGTISLRLGDLEQRGLVERIVSPDDRRSSVVRLTPAGRERFAQCAPAHLALQNRLLATLGPDEQQRLADLLRTLLVAFEDRRPDGCPTALAGLDLHPAHATRALQEQLGLAERDGLLVRAVAPDSAAERAGLRVGDLLIELSGRPLRAVTALAHALADGGPTPIALLRGGDRHEATLRPDRGGDA